LKDHFRQAGDVCFSDVRRDKDGREYGIVEFKSESDMKDAVSKFDRSKMKGNTINVFAEFDKDKRRSASPAGKRRRSASRSPSPNRSPKRARKDDDDKDGGPKEAEKGKETQGSPQRKEGSGTPPRDD